MRTGNITRGLLLIFVGLIILLDNFDLINFHWQAMTHLWPLLLIVIGANMMFSGRQGVAPLLSLCITLSALIFAGWYGTRYQPERKWGNNKHWNLPKHSSSPRNSSFTAPYQDSIDRAHLSITGGATSYKLKDTTTNLFDADVTYQWGSYSLRNSSHDSTEMLTFSMHSGGKSWSVNGEGNEASLRLNRNPVWDISVETGAGEAELDLRPFKINTLALKGGAASFEVKLGQPDSLTTVTAETGAAEVDIKIPISAGCKIEVQTGLSSRDFQGFIRQSDGSFITPNYHSSSGKIHINLKGGLSDFEVKRY